MNADTVIPYLYIAASVFFVFGLKMLSKSSSARRGNMVSSIGMLTAIVATLLYAGMAYQ